MGYFLGDSFTSFLSALSGMSQQTFNTVLGSVLGLVFAGLLLIVVYRVTVEIYDRREFRRFEKECKEAEWNQVSACSFFH